MFKFLRKFFSLFSSRKQHKKGRKLKLSERRALKKEAKRAKKEAREKKNVDVALKVFNEATGKSGIHFKDTNIIMDHYTKKKNKDDASSYMSDKDLKKFKKDFKNEKKTYDSVNEIFEDPEVIKEIEEKSGKDFKKHADEVKKKKHRTPKDKAEDYANFMNRSEWYEEHREALQWFSRMRKSGKMMRIFDDVRSTHHISDDQANRARKEYSRLKEKFNSLDIDNVAWVKDYMEEVWAVASGNYDVNRWTYQEGEPDYADFGENWTITR